jgi:hypothetical protein
MVAWSIAVALTMSLSEQDCCSLTAHSVTNCAAVRSESGMAAWKDGDVALVCAPQQVADLLGEVILLAAGNFRRG